MIPLMGARSRALRRPLEHRSDRHCTDWSTADQGALAALYGRERAWWSDRLDWDTEESWRQVDIARRAGRLPGVAIAGAGGRIEAIGYCFLDEGVAQLAVSTTASAADEERVTHALLDHAVRRGATAASCFVPHAHDTVHTHGALGRMGFDVECHRYLTRDLAAGEDRTVASEAWQATDASDVARLLQAAYGSKGRHFAVHGRLDQWERYVGNLTSYTGCGRFLPAASRIWRDGADVLGAALLTVISPGVVHLAQLAVHPAARGRGLAGNLLDDAMQVAASAGCHRMTLLVDDASAAAARLYAVRGFVPRERFVAAWLPLGQAA